MQKTTHYAKKKNNLKGDDGRQQTADAVCDEICIHTTGSVSSCYRYMHAIPTKLVRALYSRYN